MVKTVRLLAEVRVSTPFGDITLGEVSLPPVGFPKLDDRKKEALGHAVGADLAIVIGLIPWVGDIIEDILKTHHTIEIRNLLTPEELDRYTRHTKLNPETLALIRTFLETERQ